MAVFRPFSTSVIHVHGLRDRRDGFESCICYLMSLAHIEKTHRLITTFLHTFLKLGSCRRYSNISMAQKIRTDEGVLRVIPPPGKEAP